MAPLFKKQSEFWCRNIYNGLVSAYTKKLFFFFGRGWRGTLVLKAQSSFAKFPVPTILPRPQLLEEGEKRSNLGRRKWGGGRHVKVLTCVHFSWCWQPTCMLHIQPYFQNPSETIPSLSLKNFKKKKKKKPLKYLDITNQHAPSGLSQRKQWSLPPLTTLLMNNTNNSTKN